MTKVKFPVHMLSCPVCGSMMNYCRFGEPGPTRCRQCDYQEPSGNAELMQFASEVVAEYALASGINKVDLGGNAGTLDPHEGLLPMVSLPILAKRANTFAIFGTSTQAMLLSDTCITEVGDKGAFFGARARYDGTTNNTQRALYNLSQHLILVTYAVDEARFITSEMQNTSPEKITTLHVKHLPFFKESQKATQSINLEKVGEKESPEMHLTQTRPSLGGE